MMFALLLALAHGHALAPAGLELQLGDDGAAAHVVWRTPSRDPAGVSLRPRFPDDCALDVASEGEDGDGAWVVRGDLTCATSLVGRVVRIDGLSGAPVDVVVTARQCGNVVRALLHDPTDAWTVEAPVPRPSGAGWPWRAAVGWVGALVAAELAARASRGWAVVAVGCGAAWWLLVSGGPAW